MSFNNLFSLNPIKRISALNRFLDQFTFKKANRLLKKEIEIILASDDYPFYDYGQNYFYQSFRKVGIRGLRSTEERIKILDINSLISNKTVLDIGCNSGFLLMQLSNNYKYAEGIDINHTMIKIANTVKKRLKLSNVFFHNESIENFKCNRKYDVILSLANHDTFDQNIKLNLIEYFTKIRSLLKKEGFMVFESHPIAIEPLDKRMNYQKIIKNFFNIEKIFYADFGSFLDKNREYIIARKK